MNYLKTSFKRMFGLACLLTGLGLMANDYDLQFADPVVDCSGVPSTLCIDVEIKSTDGSTFAIGAHTIFINFNQAALSSTSYTSLNYNETNDCALGASTLALFYPPDYTADNTTGEGNMTTNVQANVDASLIDPTCAPVDAAWTKVGTFCFDVLDDNLPTNLAFDATNTEFNNANNNDAPQHAQGALAGYVAPAACASGTEVQLKVMLEGPENGGTMLIGNNTAGIIPSAQPYTAAPWNYGGTEMLGSIPADMVDWVLVSAATAASTATVVETIAGVLKSNGDIVDAGGSSTGLTFTSLTPGTDYHFIVRHRNHLDIVSPTAITAAPITSFDFTNGDQFYASVVQQKQVGSIFVMKAGDCDGNLNVNTSDNSIWTSQESDLNIYEEADFDMNANVNTTDQSYWTGNNADLGVSAINP